MAAGWVTHMWCAGMHTIIRNRETTTNDFVFYADRLLRLVRSLTAAAYMRLLCFPRWQLAATRHRQRSA